MLSHPHHRFVELTPSPLSPHFDQPLTLATKAEHVPDAYLIGLAAHHGLRFLTADTRLKHLAGTWQYLEFLI